MNDITNSPEAPMVAQQVQGKVEVIEEMGNPFMDETKDLLRLNTRDIVDPTVASSISCAEENGINSLRSLWLID